MGQASAIYAPKYKMYVKVDKVYLDDLGVSWLSRLADPDWKEFRRGNFFSAYPQVWNLLRTPKGGEDHILLGPDWLEYIRAINVYDKLSRVGHFLFNRFGNDGVEVVRTRGMAENIVCGGQMVGFNTIKNGSADIVGFNPNQPPPDPNLVNQFTHPWLVQNMTAVHISGRTWAEPFWFTVFNKEPDRGWMDLKALEDEPTVRMWAVGNPSNQQIINCFYGAFGDDGWSMIEQAVGPDFAHDVMAKYRWGLYFYNHGPLLRDMNLSLVDKARLLPHLKRV